MQDFSGENPPVNKELGNSLVKTSSYFAQASSRTQALIAH